MNLALKIRCVALLLAAGLTLAAPRPGHAQIVPAMDFHAEPKSLSLASLATKGAGPRASGGGVTCPGWTLINHTTATGSDASPSTNMTGADLFVAVIASYDVPNRPVSVNDSTASNTWILIGTFADGASQGSVTIWYVHSPATSASQIFASPGGSDQSLFVEGFSGSAASPLDQSTGTGTAGTGSPIQPGSITPTVNCELVVAAATGSDAPTSGGYAVGSGLTITDQQNYNPANWLSGAMGWVAQTGAASINPSFTYSGSTTVGTGAVIASFKHS